MPSTIVTKAAILAEFQLVKAQPQSFELSIPELCERVAFRLCVDVESVELCVAESGETA